MNKIKRYIRDWKVTQLRRQADFYGNVALVHFREAANFSLKATDCSNASITHLCNGDNEKAEKLALWAEYYRGMAQKAYEQMDANFDLRYTFTRKVLSLFGND
jgi:hypothetical protein